MSEVEQITDSSFEEDVINSGLPVLVDFWAEWCGPCKMISPVLDEVAREQGENIKFVKVNVDECPDTPAKYNVRGIPSLLIFKDGEVVATRVGAISKSQLVEFIEENI